MVSHSEARQIRYVTGKHQQVQGLRTVAFGAASMVSALVYALWAAINVALLLPLPALAPLHQYSGMRWLMLIYLALMGLVMIVCGYLDHRFLVRTLIPAQES